MFSRIGLIVYPAKAAEADAMFEAALEAGAENVESNDDVHEITTAMEDMSTVRDALEEKFGPADSAGLTWKPGNTISLEEDAAASLLKLIDVLDDSDDVQTVSGNFEIADDLLERLTA
jgi:transcriptional/translational regulatory protein YebC/TACO1